MVCQKRQFLSKIVSQPLCPLPFDKAVTGGNKGIQGDTRGYEALQGVIGDYKGLQRVRGSWSETRNMEINLPKNNLIKPTTLSI